MKDAPGMEKLCKVKVRRLAKDILCFPQVKVENLWSIEAFYTNVGGDRWVPKQLIKIKIVCGECITHHDKAYQLMSKIT